LWREGGKKKTTKGKEKGLSEPFRLQRTKNNVDSKIHWEGRNLFRGGKEGGDSRRQILERKKCRSAAGFVSHRKGEEGEPRGEKNGVLSGQV